MTCRSIMPRLLVLLALAACGSGENLAPPTGQGDSIDTPGTPGDPPAGQRTAVIVSPGRLELAVGDSAPLLAWTRTAPGDSAAAPGAVWASSDTTVALVSATGLVRARAAGAATVSATVGDTRGTAEVVVRAPSTATERLVVSPGDTTLDEGRIGQLRATVVRADGSTAPADSVQWSVEPRGVVYLSEAGRLMGRREGRTIVTARRGTLSGTARITVTPPSYVGLSASQGGSGYLPWPAGPLGPPAGETFQLVPTVRDTGGRYLPAHRVTWASSDPSTASIDSTGFVTTVRPGQAAIALRSGATGQSTSLALRVYESAPAMYRYEGCGPRSGTCATVAVAALPGPVSNPGYVDAIELVGWVENRSYEAPRAADRSAMILFASLASGYPLWSGYNEYDCAGCNDDERSPEPRLSVIWSQYAGPYDARCAADRACDSLRFTDAVDFGPAALPYEHPGQHEAHYLRGRVWFVAQLPASEWNPQQPIVADQTLIGGEGSSTAESFELRLVQSPAGAPFASGAAVAPRPAVDPPSAPSRLKLRARAALERMAGAAGRP